MKLATKVRWGAVLVVVVGSLMATALVNAESVKGPGERDLSGVWKGTIYMDGADLQKEEKLIMLELRRDGHFVSYGHDLLRGVPGVSSEGRWTQEAGDITFTGEVDGESYEVRFMFTYAPSQKRNPEVKWRLFLHDTLRGIHVHVRWLGEVPKNR